MMPPSRQRLLRGSSAFSALLARCTGSREAGQRPTRCFRIAHWGPLGRAPDRLSSPPGSSSSLPWIFSCFVITLDVPRFSARRLQDACHHLEVEQV